VKHLSTILLLLLAVAPAIGQAESVQFITGVTVIDGTERPPRKDVVVRIAGGRIAEIGSPGRVKIPRGATVIDARGKFMIPGLADMHNHLGDGTFSFSEGPSDFKRNLARMLGFGFTTIFDQGIPDHEIFAQLKQLSADDTSPYPRFFAVGIRFAAKGGHGSTLGAYTPDSVDEIPGRIAALKAANADGVKIVYDDLSYVTNEPRPMLKSAVVEAVIREAHQQGLKVYVHAPILKYAKEVLRYGADGLVHGIISDPVDAEFISLMKRNRAVYITTHAIFESVADTGGWARREKAFDDRGFIPKEIFTLGTDPQRIKAWEERWDNLWMAKAKLPVLRANAKKLQDSGVTVVLGSDTSSAGAGTGVLLGLGSQVELTLLVEAGLTPLQAIQAATINAARMIGKQDELGTIEPGKHADALILDANPLSDIANIRRIYRVIKGGVAYDPAEILRATQ
jgi:imidazolonepropionase-like amidohydrolase